MNGLRPVPERRSPPKAEGSVYVWRASRDSEFFKCLGVVKFFLNKKKSLRCPTTPCVLGIFKLRNAFSIKAEKKPSLDMTLIYLLH